jgi:hypothetical protein
MSDGSDNPYESPLTEASVVKPLASRGYLTETMLTHLKGASPWLRFVGIAGFIMCGISAVFGLTMAAGIQSLPIPGWNTAMGLGFFILYLGYVALMFFPILFIFRFGWKIKRYLHTGDEADLEAAFKNNKSLWIFMGILSIIFLTFLGLMVAFGGLAAVIAAAM